MDAVRLDAVLSTRPGRPLREVCNGLACGLGRLVHLGIAKAPCRSTLSYANEHRPAALFEDLFWTALARFREQQVLGGRNHKFRFKNKLLSLDSTTISLCLALFPWAKFRRAKGGVKAHVLLDHDDYLPAYVPLTEAKRSDVKLADSFALNPDSIVALDRGYTDYALFGRWTMAGIYFVTRLKDNAAYEVVAECEIPANRGILAGQIIQLTAARARTDCPCLLRRVVVWDADNQREIVLLTNLREFGSTTITAIYKERWQIELLFKALKQNLTVKTFVGTSANALRIQIWTASIALLLLKWLHDPMETPHCFCRLNNLRSPSLELDRPGQAQRADLHLKMPNSVPPAACFHQPPTRDLPALDRSG